MPPWGELIWKYSHGVPCHSKFALISRESFVPELALTGNQKRITTMMHTEDAQLGFLKRGTLRDQSERQRTVVSSGKASKPRRSMFAKFAARGKSQKPKTSVLPSAAQAAEVSEPETNALASTATDSESTVVTGRQPREINEQQAHGRSQRELYDYVKQQQLGHDPQLQLGSRPRARSPVPQDHEPYDDVHVPQIPQYSEDVNVAEIPEQQYENSTTVAEITGQQPHLGSRPRSSDPEPLYENSTQMPQQLGHSTRVAQSTSRDPQVQLGHSTRVAQSTSHDPQVQLGHSTRVAQSISRDPQGATWT